MIGEGEVERLLSVEASRRDRALVAGLYLGGLSVSEACNLRWRNLQPRAGAGQVIVFGKGWRREQSQCRRKHGCCSFSYAATPAETI
jgi:integrase/recombinase XerD